MENFETQLRQAEDTVNLLAEHIRIIESSGYTLEQLKEKLSAFDHVQLYTSLAFAITSMYYVQLRVRGLDPHQHPLQQELDRVKLYMKKLNQLRLSINPDPRQPRIDKDVAHRVVKFHTENDHHITDPKIDEKHSYKRNLDTSLEVQHNDEAPKELKKKKRKRQQPLEISTTAKKKSSPLLSSSVVSPPSSLLVTSNDIITLDESLSDSVEENAVPNNSLVEKKKKKKRKVKDTITSSTVPTTNSLSSCVSDDARIIDFSNQTAVTCPLITPVSTFSKSASLKPAADMDHRSPTKKSKKKTSTPYQKKSYLDMDSPTSSSSSSKHYHGKNVLQVKSMKSSSNKNVEVSSSSDLKRTQERKISSSTNIRKKNK